MKTEERNTVTFNKIEEETHQNYTTFNFKKGSFRELRASKKNLKIQLYQEENKILEVSERKSNSIVDQRPTFSKEGFFQPKDEKILKKKFSERELLNSSFLKISDSDNENLKNEGNEKKNFFDDVGKENENLDFSAKKKF